MKGVRPSLSAVQIPPQSLLLGVRGVMIAGDVLGGFQAVGDGGLACLHGGAPPRPLDPCGQSDLGRWPVVDQTGRAGMKPPGMPSGACKISVKPVDAPVRS